MARPRPDTKILPTSLRLPAPLKEFLRDTALDRRQPMSELIIWILEQWPRYKKHKEKIDAKQVR